MPSDVMSSKVLNIEKVGENPVKRLMGPASKRLLKIKEIQKPEEITASTARKVPKLSLNIREIPKDPENVSSPLTPNAILKKKLNIKPIEPEVKIPEPEEKKPSIALTITLQMFQL